MTSPSRISRGPRQLRRLVEDNNADCACKLCDVNEFVETVLFLNSHRLRNSHRQQIEQMAQNAWGVAIAKFNRDKLATQTLSALEATLN